MAKAASDEGDVQSLFLDIDLGEFGGRMRFQDLESFRAWLGEERARWQWLSRGSKCRAHQTFQSKVEQHFRDLDAVSERMFKAPQGQFEADRKSLQNHIEHWYRLKPQVLHSTSPAGKLVLELADESATAAVSAAAAILELPDFGVQNKESFQGAFRAEAFRAGIDPGKPDACEASFRETTQRAEASFVELDTRIRSTVEKADDLLQGTHQLRVRFEKESAESLKQFKEEAAEKIHHATSTFEATNQAFMTQMKLQSAVSYWREKKEYHRDQIPKFRRASLRSGIYGALAIGAYIWFLVPRVPGGGGFFIPWQALAGFFVLTLLIIWLTRVLVRLMLSHVHMESDAYEREVMATTFVALLRGEDGQPRCRKG